MQLHYEVYFENYRWFSVKRGLVRSFTTDASMPTNGCHQANGILFTGTGLGGIVVPFVAEFLLNRYGQRIAFITLVSLCTPSDEPRAQ